MNVLGLAELVSILERRAALLRDSPAVRPRRIALQGLVEWSYDLLHGDEKTLLQQLAVHRGGASLASLVAVAATHGLNEATVAYLVAALVDKSIVSASFAGGAARYDMLDTVREYVLERLAESGGLAAARAAHAEYFAALADEARVAAARAGMAALASRLELENDNLWAALAYARDAPDPGVAIRLGTLAWYFGAGRTASPRDGASSSSRWPPRAMTHRSSCGSSCSPTSATSRPRSSISTPRSRQANARSRSPRRLRLPGSCGLAQLTLALALAQSGDGRTG